MFRLITAAIFLILPSLTQAAELAQSAEVSTTSPVFTSPSHEMLAGHWTMVKVHCPGGEVRPGMEHDQRMDQIAFRFFANDESRAIMLFQAQDGCKGEAQFRLTVEGKTIQLSEGKILRKLCSSGKTGDLAEDSPSLLPPLEFRRGTMGDEVVWSFSGTSRCVSGKTVEFIFIRTPTM